MKDRVRITVEASHAQLVFDARILGNDAPGLATAAPFSRLEFTGLLSHGRTANSFPVSHRVSSGSEFRFQRYWPWTGSAEASLGDVAEFQREDMRLDLIARTQKEEER